MKRRTRNKLNLCFSNNMSGPIQDHGFPFSFIRLPLVHPQSHSLSPPPTITISLTVLYRAVYSSMLNRETAGSPETIMSTKLHSITFQRTVVFHVTAMRTPNLIIILKMYYACFKLWVNSTTAPLQYSSVVLRLYSLHPQVMIVCSLHSLTYLLTAHI
jgi:hypothetical protein